MEQSPTKRCRKNKPRNTSDPKTWNEIVWKTFDLKITANLNSKGNSYYTEVSTMEQHITDDMPPALLLEKCTIPTGSNNMTICVNDMQYQRPLHRIRFLLRIRQETGNVLNSDEQASHLCMDAINVNGKGEIHCNNPNHMVIEDDCTNKSRQRCAGWIWIRPYAGNPGGFWYPSCVHKPLCIRYTPKSQVPTVIQDFYNK
jgi:hypothetical protein